MKKQILILTFFVVAILANVNDAFAQVLTNSEFGSTPIPLANCIGTPQQPKAGIPYTYEFDNTGFGDGGPATQFLFWATKDPDFVSAVPTITNQASDSLQVTTGDLLYASPSYWDTTATSSVEITWSADLLGRTSYQTAVGDPGTVAVPTSTFVVGWATNDCTDNIKVWEIDPSPSFTVDIRIIDDATRDTLPYGDLTATQCVDEVRAAKYNSGTNLVDYNFGWDTLYYEVIAANYVDEWVPTFFLTGLDGTIQTASIGWASSWANAQAGTFVEGPLNITGGSVTGTTALSAATQAENAAGVALYARVVIANNNYETLTASTIGLSVAGEDANGFDIDDDAACTIPATAADAADDDATTRTITPRPTLQEGTPTIITVGAVTAP